jgi:hypothetical protein
MAVAIPTGPACPRCQAPNYKMSLFCDNCRVYLRDDTQTVERVTYNRRFWGDYLLEGLLILVTLVIGWFIWLIFTSKTGQTPAKRLLNVYPISVETGRVIGQGETWLREVVIKILVVGAINAFIGVAGLIDAVWVFFDKDRQALHDKVLKQVVIYAPAGIPAAMQQMANAPVMYQTAPLIPGQSAPAPQHASAQDVGEELRELNRLKSEGLITDDEFEQKRQALISRM